MTHYAVARCECTRAALAYPLLAVYMIITLSRSFIIQSFINLNIFLILVNYSRMLCELCRLSVSANPQYDISLIVRVLIVNG